MLDDHHIEYKDNFQRVQDFLHAPCIYCGHQGPYKKLSTTSTTLADICPKHDLPVEIKDQYYRIREYLLFRDDWDTLCEMVEHHRADFPDLLGRPDLREMSWNLTQLCEAGVHDKSSILSLWSLIQKFLAGDFHCIPLATPADPFL